MAETPSNRRRKGREAFVPDYDYMDLQPYKKGTWAYTYYLKDWIDGWNEAQRAWDVEQKELFGQKICPCCRKEL